MRIQLNLATNALQTHRRLFVGAGAVALLGGITFLALGWHVYAVRKAEAETRAITDATRQKLEASQSERNNLERFFNQPENARLHDRAAFLNSIIDASSFNWTLMFMDLERVMPGGVRVISIEPQQVKGRVLVKLKVGANSEESKLKFIRALEASKEFSGVELVSDKVALPTDTQSERDTVELNLVYSRI
jgi:type IV pilus assembly protein PilN